MPRAVQAGPILSLFVFMLLAGPGVDSSRAQTESKAPEIRAKTWFNASEYRRPALKAMAGKVVLLFFWTMDDSNCQRAVEIVNQWYSKYKEKGLEVIGIHSPEIDFDSSVAPKVGPELGRRIDFSESDLFQKIESLKIKFPVVSDRDSSVRAAYSGPAWPSFILVDRAGYIRAEYQSPLTFREVEKSLETLVMETTPGSHEKTRP